MNFEWPGTALEQAIAKYLVEVTGGHWVTIVRQGVGKLLGVNVKRGGTLVIRDLLERVAQSTDAEPVAEIVEANTPAAELIFGRDIKFFGPIHKVPIGTKLYAAPPAPSFAVKVSDAIIGAALDAFDQKAGYSKIEKMRAALEAALSAQVQE